MQIYTRNQNLVHDLGDRLDQAAVLLSHKAVPPLLLLQGLLVARPEELHVVTAAILWTRRILSQKRRGEDSPPSSRYELVGANLASPQLPLPSGRLVVDLHLVALPALLRDRALTSRRVSDAT